MRVISAALAILVGVLSGSAVAEDDNPVAPFSSVRPGGKIPSPWRVQPIPGVERMNNFSFVADGAGITVLRIASSNSSGSLVLPLSLDAGARPRLTWRWMVNNVIGSADLERKDGDDFAARLYVMFEPVAGEVGAFESIQLDVARVLFGKDLPSRVLCYVWDNVHPKGFEAWNPFTDRVRTIVVNNVADGVGNWKIVERNLAEDYRRAFGEGGARVVGIAVSSDTDNTGESVVAHFGDVVMSTRP